MEILISIPVIGMLGWFVDQYVQNKAEVPDRLLAWFIISILACAWALVTVYQFNRYRSVSGPLIALVDALFMGAFIGMAIIFRGISDTDCGNLDVPVGVTFGDNTYSGGSDLNASINKPCALMKASWALSIINCVLFFITACLSWTLYRSYRSSTYRTSTKG